MEIRRTNAAWLLGSVAIAGTVVLLLLRLPVLLREGALMAGIFVTSLGAAGAVLVTAEGAERLRTPTVEIRSKVGAGDSTVAGIVLGLSRGNSVREAARLGMAAGAAAVMTEGTSLCRKEDVERLYEKMD